MIICQYSVENNKLNYPSSQNFEPLLQTSIQILGHINITAYNHCYKKHAPLCEVFRVEWQNIRHFDKIEMTIICIF